MPGLTVELSYDIRVLKTYVEKEGPRVGSMTSAVLVYQYILQYTETVKA